MQPKEAETFLYKFMWRPWSSLGVDSFPHRSPHPPSSWWPAQCIWVMVRALTALISRQREQNIGKPITRCVLSSWSFSVSQGLRVPPLISHKTHFGHLEGVIHVWSKVSWATKKRSGHDRREDAIQKAGKRRDEEAHHVFIGMGGCAGWGRIDCAWQEISVEVPTEGSGGVLES